jgi:hypothetical protein
MTKLRPLASSLPRLLVAVLALSLGCVSVPGEPISRKLNATLVSPNGDEGAALIELTGSGLGELTVREGRAFTAGTEQSVRAVIVLDEPGKRRFQIEMDDPNAAISATVLEVADGDNEVRASLAGYDVEFAR